MPQITPFTVIAHIRNDFSEKFGIPRQSGLVDLPSRIILEPEYRNADALRGIEGYSHLWLLWQFSKAVQNGFSPTVRPPRLGGNIRMGVFATRAPYRPNPIGLSSVKLEKVEWRTPDGPVLHISGADLLDGTPIYDIKPYLAYTDSHPDATGGFAKGLEEPHLHVEIAPTLAEKLPPDKSQTILALLAEDPRPGYQDDPNRIYKMAFGQVEVHFTVKDDLLTVTDIYNKKG